MMLSLQRPILIPKYDYRKYQDVFWMYYSFVDIAHVFCFYSKNTITDSISNVWSDPRSLFAGCNEVTNFVLEHVATEKTKETSWDSICLSFCALFWGETN